MNKELNKKKFIARNKKAFHDYEVLERLEAGIELVGTEVKSIRSGKVNLLDSYARSQRNELFIYHMHISPFDFGNQFNHDPYRKRKLLLHKNEIIKLSSETEKKQLSIIPLSIYIDRQWVKLELGLCRGLKKHDKRQKIASDESKRRLAKLMKNAY